MVEEYTGFTHIHKPLSEISEEEIEKVKEQAINFVYGKIKSDGLNPEDFIGVLTVEQLYTDTFNSQIFNEPYANANIPLVNITYKMKVKP